MTARLLLPLLMLLLPAAIFPGGGRLMAQRKNSISSARLKPGSAATIGYAEPYDTVGCRLGMVRFTGYDKALRASKETVFLSNLMADSTVEAVWFTITYLDMGGRELHKLSRRHRVSVPPGSTRRLDFPTWDTQRAFYFHLSPPPRTSAIPYSVIITADTLLIAR